MTLEMDNKPKEKEKALQETLWANKSLLFLLVMANHGISERGVASPFSEAQFSFTEIHGQSLTCF